jgi:pimeloyl-ACP methyl ester carboxylesterase
MQRLEYPANSNGDVRAQTLLILMAGAGDNHHAFANNGVIDTARAHGCGADIWCVDADVSYFTDQSIRTRLHDDTMTDATRLGYERIWMGGISLGGFASLIYAERHAKDLAGLVLFAPYMGNRGTLAEIESSGGLDEWSPGVLSAHDERRVWEWVRSTRSATQQSPALPIHLFYGDKDRFAAFHDLFATRLPDEQVTTIEGAHDWQTWRQLFNLFFAAHIVDRN